MDRDDDRLTEFLLAQNASALARIEQRLMAIEGHVTRHLTPADVAKLLAGGGLVLLALTGNTELAKRLLGVL